MPPETAAERIARLRREKKKREEQTAARSKTGQASRDGGSRSTTPRAKSFGSNETADQKARRQVNERNAKLDAAKAAKKTAAAKKVMASDAPKKAAAAARLAAKYAPKGARKAAKKIAKNVSRSLGKAHRTAAGKSKQRKPLF